MVLMLEAGRSIRGVIRGLRAEQRNDVEIMLRPDSRPGSISAPVDPQGAYVLNGVPPGRAVMTVFGAVAQFDKTVEVPADRDMTVEHRFSGGCALVRPHHAGRQARPPGSSGCDRSRTSPTCSIAP